MSFGAREKSLQSCTTAAKLKWPLHFWQGCWLSSRLAYFYWEKIKQGKKLRTTEQSPGLSVFLTLVLWKMELWASVVGIGSMELFEDLLVLPEQLQHLSHRTSYARLSEETKKIGTQKSGVVNMSSKFGMSYNCWIPSLRFDHPVKHNCDMTTPLRLQPTYHNPPAAHPF